MIPKVKNVGFTVGLAALFLALWGFGSFAAAPEGFSGFGKTTDVSPDDETLVFSYARR